MPYLCGFAGFFFFLIIKSPSDLIRARPPALSGDALPLK